MGAAAIVPAAAGLASGIFQGISAQGQTKATQALAKQQMRDQEGQYADWLAGQTQLGGLRDQVVYQLMNQMGMSPQAFNPVNYGAPVNSGQQGLGGIDLNKLAQETAAYTPGAGGTNTNVAQATLGQLGYSNASDIQTKNNPGSQSYSYGGYTYANGTGPLAAQTQGLNEGYTLQSTQGQGEWNSANPSGGSFMGRTYTPPGQASAYAQGPQVPAPHAGYSLGGGGAPGAQTPSGPGTSGSTGWGGTGVGAMYPSSATMSPPSRVGPGAQYNWGG